MTFDFTIHQVVVFMLVLSRVSAVVMTAPVTGAHSIPMRIRAMLALALALLVTPLVRSADFSTPTSLAQMGLLVANEVFVGIALGFGVKILFSALQLAGQMIAQTGGMQMANFADPNSGAQISVFSQMFDTVLVIVFVLMNGPSMILAAMIETFQTMPAGEAHMSLDVAPLLSLLAGETFSMAVRAGAPSVIAILVAILMTGLISRTLPQLNLLQIGFSINILILLFALAISLSGGIWIVSEHFESTIQTLRETIAPPAVYP
jgi:flagellar biosynthesis protein FliR